MIKRLNNYYWRLIRAISRNPYHIALAWRMLGVTIGENTAIYRDVRFGRGGKDPIIIGKNCVLTGCVILGHDASTNAFLGFPKGKPSIRIPTIIEDNCFVGLNAIILMGVRVGEGSIVGAGSVVTKNVPPHSIVVGNPAKIIMTVEELIAKRREMARQHPEYFPFMPPNSDASSDQP